MTSVADAARGPRFGSVAELAAYAGLSPRTIRRLVEAGKVRGRKVGRRLLIPFEDIDAYILNGDHPRRPTVQATPTPTPHLPNPGTEPVPFVPSITPEELARRNRAAMALLDEWEADVEGEQDQRETMDVLREALGPGRIASGRPTIS